MATRFFPFGGIDTNPRSHRRIQFQGSRMNTELVPIARSSVLKGIPRPRPSRRSQRPLRLLWSCRIDAEVHRAAPVVDGDRVLLALRDEDGEGRQGVLCLDLETGRPRWRLTTDASLKNAVAVSDGLAAAVSVTGRIAAFDARTGAGRWQTDLPGYPDRWVYASPVIADGVVYAGGKAGYGAYDLRTGRQIWYTGPFDTRSDAWSCYAGPVVAGNLLVLLVQRLGLVALDRASGQEVWRRELAVEYTYPRPIAVAGRIFTGGKPGEVAALNAATGEIVWSRRASRRARRYRHISGLGADEAAVCVTGPSGEVRAYSPKGSLKWRFKVEKELLDMTPYYLGAYTATGGPVPMGDRLALGANDGHLYLLDRRTGKAMDRWAFGSPVSAPPCAAGDRLVAASFNGLVACFEARS